METTQEFVDILQAQVFNFVWGNKPPKIKNVVAFLKHEEGGLNLPHIESYIKANKFGLIKRFLEDGNWIQYLKTFLPEISLTYFLHSSMDPDTLPQNIPTFYRQILHIWFSLNPEPITYEQIISESLYLNRHIKIDKKYTFFEPLLRNKVLNVNDLLADGKIMSFVELCGKHGQLISHYEYMCLIDAIPLSWKNTLKQKPETNTFDSYLPNYDILNINIQNRHKNIKDVKTKDVYSLLISKYNTKPSCIKAWHTRLNITLDDAEWKNVFIMPKIYIKNIRIREFQYKITHRYYGCDSKVSKWDSSVSATCKLCNNGIANILHTFYLCQVTQIFWEDLEDWMNSNIFMHNPIKLNAATVLIGDPTHLKTGHMLNHCLVYAKYFIHRQRQINKCPELRSSIPFYNTVLQTEKERYCMTGKLKLFSNIFGRMSEELSV